jgi:transcriptional regulator GlxA family with amidase domain
LRIADLAKTMGVTVRSLQIGFRRQFGCSPLQYLLTRRLELARERLMSPMPGDTITMIATEHGFMNLGKFASRYRARFCELPSETLRRRRSALQA